MGVQQPARRPDGAHRLEAVVILKQAASLVAAATLFAAFTGGTDDFVPKRDLSATNEYYVDGEVVHELDSEVSGRHWVLTYYALWTGPDDPEPTEFNWVMGNDEGQVVARGEFTLHAQEVIGGVAGTVYPDEMPGVPSTGEVECEKEVTG